MDYETMLLLEHKMNGDIASTMNALYCYSDTLGWQRMTVCNPLVFYVKECGYIAGRGHYVVIDNTEGFDIDTNAVILHRVDKEIFEEEIIAIERMTHLTDPPKPSNRMALFTKEKVALNGKEIRILTYKQQLIKILNK